MDACLNAITIAAYCVIAISLIIEGMIEIFVTIDEERLFYYLALLKIKPNDYYGEDDERWESTIKTLKAEGKNIDVIAPDLMYDWKIRRREDLVIPALRKAIELAIFHFELNLAEAANRLSDPSVYQMITKKQEEGSFIIKGNLRGLTKKSGIIDIKKRIRQNVKELRLLQKAGEHFARYSLKVQITT